jgi:hypothetical protein
VFKKFKALVELQSGYKLKKLRSDRAGEYTSNEFQEFCVKQEMERQLTIAYSPQQNGVSERRNRTICEMAKSMLIEKEMPMRFWAEAVSTTVYLQNRCYTTSVMEKTPFEAFTRRKPGVKHLKVFGCLCYTHIPSSLRQKWDSKAGKGVFVGYGSCEKGYRVYDLKSEKIVLSRSVIFSEDKSWNWGRNRMNQMQMPLNLEGDEAEGENPEEHSAAIQPDNVECSYPNSTVEELVENTDSDNSQQSTPSSTPVKLKILGRYICKVPHVHHRT